MYYVIISEDKLSGRRSISLYFVECVSVGFLPDRYIHLSFKPATCWNHQPGMLPPNSAPSRVVPQWGRAHWARDTSCWPAHHPALGSRQGHWTDTFSQMDCSWRQRGCQFWPPTWVLRVAAGPKNKLCSWCHILDHRSGLEREKSLTSLASHSSSGFSSLHSSSESFSSQYSWQPFLQ